MSIKLTFRSISWSSQWALFLALVLVLPSRGLPQQPPQTSPVVVNPQPAAQRKVLRIFVLQGDNAVNSIPDRRVITPVVEVRDENDLPVEGADVVFRLPASGPGGVFPGQELTRTVRTTLQAQAAAPYILNSTPGTFEITVHASTGDRFGQTTITQTNSLQSSEQLESDAKSRGPWYTNWKFLAIAAGTATAAAVIFTVRGNGSQTTTPTLIIRPGSPVFGGLR